MQLFYSPNIHESQAEFVFDKQESNHITKVLRKKVGDVLCLTNGKGWRFDAEITEVFSKSCTVKIIESQLVKKPKYHLHIAIAPTKMNDRFEWFLEKATEIGIQSITPIICERSERKVIKQERFEKVIQTAMKQSFQFYKPKLNDVKTFSEFIKKNQSTQKFIAHCENTEKQNLLNLIEPKADYTILIGPEGDFSVKEIETALKAEYIPITLGNTRLRTETAGIVACHTVSIAN